MCGPSWPAAAVTGSYRCRPRAARLPGGLPGRDCWPMCWCPNTWIIYRCIGSPKSMRVRACPWSARPWLTGSAKRAGSCSPWSTGCDNTSWPPTKSTPTTRRSPCLPPARVKPRPDACGRMCATSAPQVVAHRRRSGLPTRRIAKASTPEPPSPGLRRDVASRWLCRFRANLCLGHDSRGGMLGACSTQVFRPAQGTGLADCG